jgi:hypothetical protein
MVDNGLAVRLTLPKEKGDGSFREGDEIASFPVRVERFDLMNKNPTAGAEIYGRLMEVLLESLFGLRPESLARKNPGRAETRSAGVLGVTIGYLCH